MRAFKLGEKKISFGPEQKGERSRFRAATARLEPHRTFGFQELMPAVALVNQENP